MYFVKKKKQKQQQQKHTPKNINITCKKKNNDQGMIVFNIEFVSD